MVVSRRVFIVNVLQGGGNICSQECVVSDVSLSTMSHSHSSQTRTLYGAALVYNGIPEDDVYLPHIYRYTSSLKS